MSSVIAPGTVERPWRAYAALAAGVVCIAWSAIFVRWAGVPGPSSALWRTLVAAVVLVPWRLARRSGPVPSRRVALLAVLAGASFGIDLAFFNTAVLRTSAGTATLLGNNSPLMVALGLWLVFGERPPRAFWGGLALAVAGCLTIMGADALRRGGAALGDPAGDLMAVSASVFFGVYLIINRRLRAGMDTLTFTALAIVGSALTMLLVCLALRLPLAGFAPRTWASLVALGLISQLGGYLAITYALGHLPATPSAVGLLAQAPLTALLSVPLLGERLSWTQLVGGALVLSGIWLVNRPAPGHEVVETFE